MIGMVAAFYSLVFAAGFRVSSGDDFFRALMTYEFRQVPYLISDAFGDCSLLWFPTHFWITGSLFHLTGQLIASLRIVSVLCGIGALFVLFLLATELFSQRAGYLSVLLAATLPWQVWLSLSLAETTLYISCVLCAFLFLVKWKKTSRSSHVLLSALFFLLSSMFRPEGWVFSALFCLYLCTHLLSIRHCKDGRGALFGAMIIAILFILFWTGYNVMKFGDPLYFLHSNVETIQEQTDYADIAMWARGLQYVFLMFVVSPLLFIIIGLGGLFDLRNHRRNWYYIALVLGELIVMTVIALLGAGTSAAPQRYVMINILLLTPFAAGLLERLWQTKQGLVVALSIIGAVTVMHVTKCFLYSDLFTDTVAVGQRLKRHFDSGKISPDSQICSELIFRRVLGIPVDHHQRFILLSSAHAGLAAYSEHPRNFVLNVLQLTPRKLYEHSMFVDLSSEGHPSKDELGRWLIKNRISHIVLRDRGLMGAVPETYRLKEVVGTYAIFGERKLGMADLQERTGSQYRHSAEGRIMGTGVVLQDHRYEGRVFPRSLQLLWRMNADFKPDRHRIRMRFKKLDDPRVFFERHLTPLLRFCKTPALAQIQTIKDQVPLELDPDMPSGKYVPTLVLQERSDGSGAFQDSGKIILPPVTLISSKRGILLNFLKGHDISITLLLKTILVL